MARKRENNGNNHSNGNGNGNGSNNNGNGSNNNGNGGNNNVNGNNGNGGNNKGVRRGKGKDNGSYVRVTSLGGLNEIGKNITVFETPEDIAVVDCGVAFPENEMLGIDLVIPDVTYLVKNASKIRGLVLTHAHEDHIGAIPYVLKQVNMPIYGTKLTLGLLGNKLREHGLLETTKMHCVKQGETVTVGKLKFEFIRTSHSIADSVALAIHTDVGVIVHSGDFKVDFTPVDNERIDLQKFAELGKKGVRLFLCDSTNVERKGFSMSEARVGEVFDGIFRDSLRSRIIVATFSSNIHRIQQVITTAHRYKRKVAVLGRSMVNAVTTAGELGYLKIPANTMIDITEINGVADQKLVIIMTGSQGESMAALSRIAYSEHKQVDIKPNDKVIISASAIPGNEKTVSRVINELFRKGAEVIYEQIAETHVSGHAMQEELKLMHAIVKPEYFMPVHGEYRHLKQHADLAVKLGMDKRNVFLMSVGETLELTRRGARRLQERIPSGHVFVDGLGVGDVGNVVLRDRRYLAQDGLIVVVVTMDGNSGLVIAGPDVISRGFVYVRENEELMDEARRVVCDVLEICEQKRIVEWSFIKSKIKDALKSFLWQKTKRSPVILTIIMEV